MGPGATQNYPQTYNEPSTKSTGEPGARLLKRRPMIPTSETVESILGNDYDQIAVILGGWQKVKARMGWDEYAGKIDDRARDMLRDKFRELRRHGYLNPVVHDGVITCSRIVHKVDEKIPTKNLDLCAMCARECDRRDWRGVFLRVNGAEVQPCWR